MNVVRRTAAAAFAAATMLMMVAAPAFAHGDNESNKAGDLVRQAIAHIVHDPKNTMDAAEKLEDAESAANKQGVDMALVRQAAAALERGDAHAARSLLERSIGARSHLTRDDPLPIGQTHPHATGAETGINVVTDPLAAHRAVTGGDTAALAGLAALGALGTYLAVRFRPHNGEAPR
ncbi:MAG TPA: hypothetical protein VHD87_02515 [Acidimicrobiales bacterium]|nr:hypothetical protein [Acidimicrobiales bacterium]